LAFASESYAAQAWETFGNIPRLQHPNISFLRGTVTNINYEQRTATYKPINSAQELTQNYDYVAVCTGLRRNWPVVPRELTREKYLLETQDYVRGIREAKDGVVVIGAGTFNL
jgi:NADH dehydrogenase FAD-containing subunit